MPDNFAREKKRGKRRGHKSTFCKVEYYLQTCRNLLQFASTLAEAPSSHLGQSDRENLSCSDSFPQI